MKIIKKIYDFQKELFGKKSYSLDNIDIKLLDYMNYSNGFFIEAGAYNGITQSNTYYYEKHKKWTGILVEPIPDHAKLCRINRPNSTIENCALVPFGFENEFVNMRYSGLMSLVIGSMKTEAEESAHIERGIEIQSKVNKSYQIRVPARTLTSILDQYKVKDIDFLSLDVEGYELNVLKGLDLERYHPKFILVEVRERDQITKLLQTHYKPIAELSHHDILYKAL